MQNQRILIVEDELNSRNFLKKIVQNYCTGFEVVGEAESITNGIRKIEELEPDILLLDIELRDGLSFKILEEIQESRYKVIFITSHLHYTLKAIKLSAIDYILKPVSIEELKTALQKARNISWNVDAMSLLKNSTTDDFKHIVILSKEKYLRLDFDSIFAFESDSNYTRIFLKDTSHLVSNSLNHYEDLVPDNFFRAHKSCIVNCDKVKEVDSGRGGEIFLNNGLCFPVAYRRKGDLLSRITKS